MSEIPKYIDEALDTVDAAMFTGDCFDNHPKRLDELEEYIERWQKQIDRCRYNIAVDEQKKRDSIMPKYAVKPYILLSPKNVVLAAGSKEEMETMADGTHKSFGDYYQNCKVKMRTSDLYLNNNRKHVTIEFYDSEWTVPVHTEGLFTPCFFDNLPDAKQCAREEYGDDCVITVEEL